MYRFFQLTEEATQVKHLQMELCEEWHVNYQEFLSDCCILTAVSKPIGFETAVSMQPVDMIQ